MSFATALPTDLLTPLAAYLRLRGSGAGSFLLESVERGRLGRYSFVGTGSRLCYLAEAEACGEPVVGYLGYDYAARLEPTVPLPDARSRFPESRFVVAETLLRFDHALGMAGVLAGDPERIGELLDAPPPESAESRAAAGPLERSPSRAEYEASVVSAQQAIRAGEAFQIVLSQRATRPTSATALELYRALRRVNPSPYLFLLELDGIALVGSSPETLVKCTGMQASLNPIAGTTEAGEGDAERLLASEKDRAEHVMLVDLGRNDLSRVCRPGTVRVARFLEPERFSHVTHLVSEVSGELCDGVGPFDLLRACFPAGTVSGAPKVRAMQLISELEGVRRGPYAGAVGYCLPEAALATPHSGVAGGSRRGHRQSPWLRDAVAQAQPRRRPLNRPVDTHEPSATNTGPTLDTCIAIRTIFLAAGVAQLQAGAGIVVDSDPAAEHEECLRKLAALEQAIELAEAPR